MSCIAVIPARMQSTRLPGKPLADIGGQPMIVRVAERVTQSKVDRVVVAADDVNVSREVERAGYEVVMTNPNHESGSDRVHEVAALIGLNEADIVVNVQGDEPLIPPQAIDYLLQHTLACQQAHGNQIMATLCEPLAAPENFVDANVVKVVTTNQQQALYFSRAPIPYSRDEEPQHLGPTQLSEIGAKRHVGIYAFTEGSLAKFVGLANTSRLEHIERLEQLRWLEAGLPLYVFESPVQIPGGVDTPEDLQKVQQLWSQQ